MKHIKDIYEVLKATKWIELTNHEDYLIKIEEGSFAIETWNNFYLEKQQVKNSIYIGKVSQEDFITIQSYKNGTLKELPKDRRGIFSQNPTSYQKLFHDKEAEIVREYKEPSKIIFLNTQKNDSIKLPFVADTKKSTARGDFFVLEKDAQSNIILLHITEEELLNKKVTLKILDKQYKIYQLMDTIYIKTNEEVENIDLEELAKKISIKLDL